MFYRMSIGQCPLFLQTLHFLPAWSEVHGHCTSRGQMSVQGSDNATVEYTLPPPPPETTNPPLSDFNFTTFEDVVMVVRRRRRIVNHYLTEGCQRNENSHPDTNKHRQQKLKVSWNQHYIDNGGESLYMEVAVSDKWKHVQTLYGVQTNENMSRQAEEPLASVGQAVKQSVSRIAIKLHWVKGITTVFTLPCLWAFLWI